MKEGMMDIKKVIPISIPPKTKTDGKNQLNVKHKADIKH
jgi:hypothetical protein